MDYKIYRSIFAPFNESRTTYHHYLPNHNLICLEKLCEIYDKLYYEGYAGRTRSNYFPFFESFPYETDNCAVLYPGWSKTDKAHEFVFKKRVWNRKLRRYLPKDYERGKRALKMRNLLNKDVIDWKLFRYLKWFQYDPAEGFVGDYNWLYTGGNIVGFNYYNYYWLITPDENEKSTFLNIIRLDSDMLPFWEKNTKPMRFRMMEKQPVYQIICRNNTDCFIFAVRQREWVTLRQFNDNLEMKEIWCCRTRETRQNNKFLTTCDTSKDSKYLSVVNNDCQMVLYDIELGTPVFSCNEPSHKMSWTRVLFNNDANVIYFADQQSFRIFDLRGDSEPIFAYQPTAVTNTCEKICNFFGSEFRDNIIYMTTSHNLIEVDIRFGKNLQRWTHMMKFAAQFGGTIRRDDKELILLQSENSRELVGIHNEGLNDDFTHSRTNPYLFETFARERVKAHCNGFGFHHKIKKRFNFKITGLHVVADFKGVQNIFTVNGGGDVFMTKLRNRKKNDTNKKDYSITPDSALGLLNLDNRCYYLQTNESAIEPGALYDVSFLLTAMNNPKRENLRRRKRRKSICHYWPRCEMYDAESLRYRTGIFAERLLPLWGIKMKSYEDGDTDEEEQDKAEELEMAKAKVEDWIKRDQTKLRLWI